MASVDHYYISAPLSGTLTVDSSSGLFSSANLFLTEWFTNIISHSSAQPAPYDLSIKSATSTDVLNLVLDVGPLALISNQGGSILNGSASAGGLALFNIAGQLSPMAGEPSPVPVPGALSLFATGLGGLGLLGWRRKRKTQA
jgi:hypothetical protein